MERMISAYARTLWDSMVVGQVEGEGLQHGKEFTARTVPQTASHALI